MSGLIRQVSSTIGTQNNEGTCFAHAATRVLARLFKVKFSQYFPIQNENCSHYYDTVDCTNIFKCFEDERAGRQTFTIGKCDTELDDDGWRKENISALLFTFIYKIITTEFGCYGGQPYDVIKYVLDHFRTLSEITSSDVMELLIPKASSIYSTSQYYIDKSVYFEYFKKLIEQLVVIITDISTNLKNGNFNTQIYQGDPYYLPIDLRNILDAGYYATLTLLQHAITITGYEETEENGGRFDLIVKNSYGESNIDWKVVKDNKIVMRELPEDVVLQCVVIVPDEDINSLTEKAAARATRNVTAQPISVLLDKMMNGSDNDRETAAGALAQLSHDDDNKNTIVYENGITILMSLLKSGTDKAKKYVVDVLGALSMNDDIRANIVADGVITVLINMAMSGTGTDKSTATSALVKLSRHDDIRGYIVKEGGIPAFIAMAKSDTDVDKDNAASMLWYLALVNDAARISIYKAGGIPVLTDIANSGSQFGKMSAVRALVELAKNDDIRTNIVNAGGIIAIIQQVKTFGRRDFNEEMSVALLTLSEHDDIRAHIVKEGGIEALCDSLDTIHLKVIVYSSKALANLLTSNDGIKRFIATKSNIRVLIEATGHENGVIDANIALIFWKLSIDDEAMAYISTKKDIGLLLIDIIKSGTDDGKTNAAGALGNMAVNDANKISIANAGGIPVLVELAKYGTDTGKENAAFALSQLALNDANKISIANAGAIQVLIKLVLFGTEVAKQYAADALSYLSVVSYIKTRIASALDSAGEIASHFDAGGNLRKSKKSRNKNKSGKKMKTRKNIRKIKTRKNRKYSR